jgi:hypothetical protein
MWSLGMILHKLLFFKLPYRCATSLFEVCRMVTTRFAPRYAAEGDANGEPISRNEEGEKIVRLEREVLSYPGYIIPFLRKI